MITRFLNSERLLQSLIVITAGAVGAWLWHCWCVFPFHSWNELRLAPTFQWANGDSIYAPPSGGPASTWIYGPLPALFFWPATWMPSVSTALLSAATLNFLFVAGAVVLVCFKSPISQHLGWWSRTGAALGCLAVWPYSSFQYLQADNLVISFGLVGHLLLLHETRRPQYLWLAAFCSAAAVGCKQTAFEAAAAQVVWLGVRDGVAEAAKHIVRMAAWGALLLIGAALVFNADDLWFNLITLPTALPWTHSVSERLGEFAGVLLAQLGIPAALIAFSRRSGRDWDKQMLLPALCWFFSLIPGLMGFLKIGGSANSLHGLQYLLPFALPWLLQFAPVGKTTHGRVCLLATATLVVISARFVVLPTPVLRPLTSHLEQGAYLSRELPHQVWFPWNPLITFYSEQRFYHAEDGMAIRTLAGRPVQAEQVAEHLPRRWHITALLSNQAHWGIAQTLPPTTYRSTTFGSWKIDSWDPITQKPESSASAAEP